MLPDQVVITGLGSVSAFGPICGLIPPRETSLRTITAWPTRGLRRAFLVDAFRAADVVPGLKTRRLDRLSVWALVAAGLAIRDARLDLSAEDSSRIAVVCGTGFGCIELTEAALRSIVENACGKCDPVIFPETLSNAPGSHVARTFGIRGPNIAVSAKGISGETALIVASSLLESGEADVALVLAGDTLTRTILEWYEAASVAFVPGEGMGAVVMQTGRKWDERGARAYARFGSGALGCDPSATSTTWGDSAQATMDVVAKVRGSGGCPAMVAGAANGSPSLDSIEAEALRALGCPLGAVFAAKAMLGEFDGSGVLRLILALSRGGAESGLLLLGAAAGGDRAAIDFEAP